MGHIKEPPGVDFIIESEPLTDTARKQISEFIHNYKTQQNTPLATKASIRIKNTRKKTVT